MSVFGGRPQHNIWSLGFRRIQDEKIGNKFNALCLICQKVLKNTSAERLKSHRNMCLYCDGSNKTKSSSLTSSESSITHLTADRNERKKIKGNSFNSQEFEDDPDNCLEPNINTSNSAFDLAVQPLKNVRHVPSQKYDSTISICSSDDFSILSSELKLNTPQSYVLDKNDEIQSSQSTDLGIEKSSSSSSNKKCNITKTKNTGLGPVGPLKLFCDQITRAQIDICNIILAKLFFGCNIPFSEVDSMHFKHFCNALRPSYKPPSRKVLSGRLLNDVHSKLCENKKFRPSSALLIDGWKNENANTKNVACMLHAATGETIFLESFDFTGISETGTELAKIVEVCVALAKEKYNTEIYAVISDNAANMMKMGRLASIWHLTCNSHTGNLLAKDLVASRISSQVKQVLKEFHGPDLEKELVKNGGFRIQLPCDTRWCSYRDSFVNLQKNLPAMKKILVDGDYKIDNSIKQLLIDEIFIKNVSDSVILFDPICQLINKCQSSTTNIADAAELWLTLTLPDDFKNNKTFSNSLNKRKDNALSEFSLTANFLHPIYQGLKFSQDSSNKSHVDIVEHFLLSTLSDDGLNSLHEYKLKSGIFGILFEKQQLTPGAFWSLAKNKHQDLSNMAEKLLNLPASTAQLERIFSNWSYVHNPLRNRLEGERSKKLLGVYYALKIEEKHINSTKDY